jgi:hypothetical protein
MRNEVNKWLYYTLLKQENYLKHLEDTEKEEPAVQRSTLQWKRVG